MRDLSELVLNIPPTTKPRVVIVGSGFGGVNLAQKLVGGPYQVVMLSTQNYHGFWPLLYQVATGSLEPDAIAEPVRKLFASRANPDFHFRPVRVTHVDPAVKQVSTLLGEVAYDYLVIATGTKANFFGNQQLQQYAFPLKQLTDAVNLRSQVLQCFEEAVLTSDESQRQALLNFVIVGGGPTGVELAGALAEMRQNVLPHDYPSLDISRMNIYLVESHERVLSPMSPESSARTRRDLEKLGVCLKLQTVASSYDGQVAVLKTGERLATRTLIWAAGVTGAVLDGLPVDTLGHGRYLVDDFNQVLGCPDVFAIGDIALMKQPAYPDGHPGMAQPAIQQGRHLAKNLLRQQPLAQWQPFAYFDKGSLAIIGRRRAVADLPGNLHLGGFVAFMAWLVVHIYFLVGFRNKLVVLANWAYRFFTNQGGTRLIIRPFVRADDQAGQELLRRQLAD